MTPEEEKDVFAFGDRTIFQLRAQSLEIDNEYGTIINAPAAPIPVVDIAAEPVAADDPIARLEQKLDAALRLLATLQQKIDSIDATLARALNR